MKPFEHYVITTFNINNGFDKDNKRNNPEYLEKRFTLFESVTIPSIVSQTNPNFSWFVFFDNNTPEQFKQRAQKALNSINYFPLYIKEKHEIASILKEKLSPKTDFLITTNLDNDDAFHNKFIENIQRNLKEKEDIYFLNFPLGYMLKKDGLFMREFLSSPFHTLVEKINTQLLTCLCVPHKQLYSLYLQGVPVYQITTEPAWLQLVHETNVINRCDVNAVLISNLNKLNYFGIHAVPAYFQEINNNKFNRIKFCLSLITSKKKTFKHKVKLIAYTMVPFIAPLWLRFQFSFQLLKRPCHQRQILDIRKMLLISKNNDSIV